MRAVTKTVDAAVHPVPSDDPNGEFEVIVSRDNRDRDGDQLWADQWAALPARLHLDTDHAFTKGQSVPFTAGSGVPRIAADGDLVVRGAFAGTPHGQLVRQLVNEGHVWSASASYLEHPTDSGGIERELLNATFTGVPANPQAVVTSSKSAQANPSFITGGKTMALNEVAIRTKTLGLAAELNRVEELHRVGKLTSDAYVKALGKVPADAENLDAAEANVKAARRYAGSADSAPDSGWATRAKDLRDKGRGPSLILTDQQCREMHTKAMNGEGCAVRTKNYSGTSDLGYSGVGLEGQIPAELAAWITARVHERRIIDRLPSTAVTAPSFEVIQHTSTTGSPAIVLEGTEKPEVKLVTNPLVLPMLKLAAHSALTWEIISDVDLMTSYLQRELPLEIVDQENHEILYGTGGATSIAGFASTTGISPIPSAPTGLAVRVRR